MTSSGGAAAAVADCRNSHRAPDIAVSDAASPIAVGALQVLAGVPAAAYLRPAEPAAESAAAPAPVAPVTEPGPASETDSLCGCGECPALQGITDAGADQFDSRTAQSPAPKLTSTDLSAMRLVVCRHKSADRPTGSHARGWFSSVVASLHRRATRSASGECDNCGTMATSLEHGDSDDGLLERHIDTGSRRNLLFTTLHHGL